ncbi:MAG: hypothetical protein SFX72_10175 [Isosphaeraceae bacterium]|nr:hypothetical protein [Isosphaeraceae bacterium]
MRARTPIRLPAPNPGPIPYPSPNESTASPISYLAPAFGLCALAVVVGLALRFRARRLDVSMRLPDALEQPTAPNEDLPARLRRIVSTYLGTDWTTKTTEEIAADPLLVDRLGPQAASDILESLRRFDAMRFSGRPQSLDDRRQDDRLAQFLDFLEAEAGATSRMIGK